MVVGLSAQDSTFFGKSNSMSSARPTSTSDQLLHGIFKATMPQVGTLPMERFPSKVGQPSDGGVVGDDERGRRLVFQFLDEVEHLRGRSLVEFRFEQEVSLVSPFLGQNGGGGTGPDGGAA